MKTLLSLFDYSGNWARHFEDAGWNVILWDIKHTSDQFQYFKDVNEACADYFYEHIFDNYGTVDGIIAALPCTDFAGSGARWWKGKDESGQTEKSIELAWQTLRIIDLCMPDFWCIENPVGRLHKLVPEMGRPRMYFNPCDYGDPYTKKTALYGDFNTDLIKTPVFPTEGSKMHKLYGGKSERTKAMRSITPEGFAKAFCAANKDFVCDENLEEDYEFIEEPQLILAL
jgi:hypothetical protein